MTVFKECDWKHFYGDVHEAIPPNAPPTRGKDINLHMFVDSDYSGDQVDAMITFRLLYIYEYGPYRVVLKEASNY
jgi:hypothetical protein